MPVAIDQPRAACAAPCPRLKVGPSEPPKGETHGQRAEDTTQVDGGEKAEENQGRRDRSHRHRPPLTQEQPRANEGAEEYPEEAERDEVHAEVERAASVLEDGRKRQG